MKRNLLITLTLCLLFSASAMAEPTVIKTYILAGQSNANGYGLAYGDVSTGELIPNQDLADIGREDLIAVNDSAYIYLGDWTTGLGSWENLGPGFASWNGVRFGSELSFGSKIQAELDEPIAIIKYTPNGTSLYSDWLEHSYDRLMAAVSDSQYRAAEFDLTLDIQGVLWMQGESDSFGVNAPAIYEERLTTFISNVRDELSLPSLKFHIAEIADSDAWGARQQIWDAQAAVVAADDNAYLVSSRDFPLFENDAAGLSWIHYTTQGVVMLGEAFADSVIAAVESDLAEDVTDGYISQLVSEDSIVIDGDLVDWSELSSLGYDGDTIEDEGAKADYVEGWIAHDNNNLYVAYQNNGDIDQTTWWPWQVYFDTDGVSSTGYQVNNTMGAEYMLQASGVYQYTGSGADWSWQYIGGATNAVNGDSAEFKIPRLLFNFEERLQVLFISRNVAFSGNSTQSGVDVYPKQFEPLPLHTELLRSQSVIWGEPGGEQAMVLAESAVTGATTLVLTESYSLLENQLITYLAESGEYYTAQIESIEGHVITLKSGLEATVSAGQNLWNFYGDDSHPNKYGFWAVADFAIRKIGFDNLASGNHVLIGDSWFDIPEKDFSVRLQARLSDAMVVNKSLGGSTSADVLNHFDSNMVNQEPDFVWVIAGINDSTSDVLADDYLSNMQEILTKIRSLGAKPIIFDSQVTQLFSGSDARTQLSHSYAQALATVDTTVKYELTDQPVEPEPEAISNFRTIAINGDLSDWETLQSFGEDANDIVEAGTKADFLEAWMAHDVESFYIAYKNDGDIDQSQWWPWQMYLDTDNNQSSGYKAGNGVGANYLIQGGSLFSYIGTGFDWSWQYEDTAEYSVMGDTVELKFARASINNPESLSTVLKARNGIFTNNFTETSIDSFPDLGESHFNYSFVESVVREVTSELPQ